MAGSYVLEMYLQSVRHSHWEANDIDIFVGTDDQLQLVMQSYNDLVARPLQLDVETVFVADLLCIS